MGSIQMLKLSLWTLKNNSGQILEMLFHWKSPATIHAAHKKIKGGLDFDWADFFWQYRFLFSFSFSSKIQSLVMFVCQNNKLHTYMYIFITNTKETVFTQCCWSLIWFTTKIASISKCILNVWGVNLNPPPLNCRFIDF